MRISVCEFLRLATQRNWFYINPGHWGSDGMEVEARRDEVHEDTIHLYKNGRRSRTLTYFEGLPSNVVRQQNKRRR